MRNVQGGCYLVDGIAKSARLGGYFYQFAADVAGKIA